MPSIAQVVKKFTNQTLTQFPKIGTDGFGRPVYGPPVQIACRWEDKQQEVITPDGRRVRSMAYLLLVSPVSVGDWVFLGTIAVVNALPTWPKPPTVNQGGREVLVSCQTPDLKASNFVYEAYL